MSSPWDSAAALPVWHDRAAGGEDGGVSAGSRQEGPSLTKYAIAASADADPSEYLMIVDEREEAENIAHELRAGGREVVVIEVERGTDKGRPSTS